MCIFYEILVSPKELSLTGNLLLLVLILPYLFIRTKSQGKLVRDFTWKVSKG